LGNHFLAHRLSALRMRTVKVCPNCTERARDDGYQVAELEGGAGASWLPAPVEPVLAA
jgi:hypothetical protein